MGWFDWALITVVIILVVVASVRQRLLHALTILLAILALVPVGVSIILYAAKGPSIEYEVLGLVKKADVSSGKTQYACEIHLRFLRGEVLMDKLLVFLPPGFLPRKHPLFSGDFVQSHSFYAPGMQPPGVFPLWDQPAPTGFMTGMLVLFESARDTSRVSMRLAFDVEVDPFRLGPFSVLQPNFRYRYEGNVPLDFGSKERQRGFLIRH